VQYPGVAEAIRADLSNFALLYRFSTLLYPSLEPGPVIEELRERLGEELDYRHEARSQSRFAELYEGHPFIHVPRIFPSHSTERVLTSELATGRRYAEVLADDEPRRARWGEIIYRFVFGSLLRFGVFNSDPHPGNYLFGDDGRVSFLDFGCVKYFPDAMLANWRQLVRSHLAGDRAAFRARLVALGFFRAETALDDDALYDWFGYFYEPISRDREFTFDRAYAAASIAHVLKPAGRFAPLGKQLNLPRDFVFANRLQWGVYSILGDLGARANFHRIQREFLERDPPCDELGRLDAEHFRKFTEARGLSGCDLAMTPDGLRERRAGAA
jgi:predicted unusual protein kinase regulating ubiquinone biosynthesis (AarF/ABC1/UbiB family)